MEKLSETRFRFFFSQYIMMAYINWTLHKLRLITKGWSVIDYKTVTKK